MESTNYKYIQDYLRVLVNDNIDEEIPNKKERRGIVIERLRKKLYYTIKLRRIFLCFK